MMTPAGIPPNTLKLGACFADQRIRLPSTFPGSSGFCEGEYPFFRAKVGKDGSYEIIGFPQGEFKLFPWVKWGADAKLPGGFESGMALAHAMLKFIRMDEGESRVVDFDLDSFGIIRVKSQVVQKKGWYNQRFSFRYWREDGQEDEAPAQHRGLHWKYGEDVRISALPGTYTVALEFSGNSAGFLRILREGIRVKTGSCTEISFSHDRNRCGEIVAHFDLPSGWGSRKTCGIFLSRPGVRALASADREGRAKFWAIPPGTYRCKLVKGTQLSLLKYSWKCVRDLGDVQVLEGKTTDMGMVRVGE
jgi:hypothetical protein